MGAKERSTGICRICVKKSWDTYWHAGTVALTGYYSLWNASRRTIAFYPLSSGSKLELEEGERPSLVLGESLFTIALLTTGNVLSLGLVILLVIVAFFSGEDAIPEEDLEGEEEREKGPADQELEQAEAEDEAEDEFNDLIDEDAGDGEVGDAEIINDGIPEFHKKLGASQIECLLRQALLKRAH